MTHINIGSARLKVAIVRTGTQEALVTSGLCEIDTKPVAPALVEGCQLGRSLDQLLLPIALVDFGRGGEAGPQ
jgi:hypothetical protein